VEGVGIQCFVSYFRSIVFLYWVGIGANLRQVLELEVGLMCCAGQEKIQDVGQEKMKKGQDAARMGVVG